mmetsp:Transcript_61986/g.110442  ORF Transcript_61986/g.110442 Transcript_61986/m.110442 type:complete len:113 (-) Transcript_61986:1366-1704(-)
MYHISMCILSTPSNWSLSLEKKGQRSFHLRQVSFHGSSQMFACFSAASVSVAPHLRSLLRASKRSHHPCLVRNILHCLQQLLRHAGPCILQSATLLNARLTPQLRGEAKHDV